MSISGAPLRAAALLLWLPLGAACQQETGHDLVRLDEPVLVPGRTSEDQIVKLEGEPTTWLVGEATPDPQPKQTSFDSAPLWGVCSTLRYEYLTDSMTADSGLKVATFFFYDHQLEGWAFDSDIREASTDFDLTRAETIRKGMSQEQVRTQIGSPSGKLFYPFILEPQDSVWLYNYQHLTARRNVSRHLKILFGPDLHVLESHVTSQEQPR